MDALELHRRGLEHAARRIEQLTPEQLRLPTPCPEWDVRGLVNHMVAGNQRFAAIARGEHIEPVTGASPDVLGDNPAAAFAESAKEIVAAFDVPGALDRPFPLRIGDVPGRVAVELRFIDTMVHCWDLARATGQDEALDPQLAEAADGFARATIKEGMRGPGRPFGPEVQVDPNAPAGLRLVAFLGRQP